MQTSLRDRNGHRAEIHGLKPVATFERPLRG